MSRAYFKPYPTENRPVAFNKMQGWFGTPSAEWKVTTHVEMTWCFMAEGEARLLQKDDCQCLNQWVSMTFPMRLLERLLTVRTEWSRK